MPAMWRNPREISVPRAPWRKNTPPKEAWGQAKEAWANGPSTPRAHDMRPQETDGIDVAALVQRIQEHVFPRRVRIKEFFVDYDPLKCGRVTRDQFVRSMGMIGVRLRTGEVDAIVAHFTEAGSSVNRPQVVSYTKFCQVVDEIFVTPNLEKTPGLEVPKPGAAVLQEFAPNPVADEARLENVMHRVALLEKTRGVNFLACFSDCDRADACSLIVPRRGGKVSISQFRRCFPFLKDFAEDEVELLVARYKTRDGSVNYLALSEDISDANVNFEPTIPTSPGVLRKDDATWEHDDVHVIQKLRSMVVERRIRINDLFRDYDRLRKGKCTYCQMRTVFSILKLDGITETDFEEIFQLYKTEDNMVHYARMCDDVDDAFTHKGLEKDPLWRSEMPGRETTETARRNKMAVPASVRDAVDDIEARIRKRVRQRRPLLRDAFQDHDRVRKGHVTRSQFMRVIDSLGFELAEVQLDMLCQVYCDRGNRHEFNYLDFCERCDVPEEHEVVAMHQSTAAFQNHKPSRYFDTEGKIIPRVAGFGGGYGTNSTRPF